METTTEVLSVDGVVLNTLAKNIESLTGRLRTPAKRTSNITIPGKHGTKRTGGKKFDQNVVTLPMWVLGCDDDGEIPSGSDERIEFFARVDELTRLFVGRDSVLDVRHTLPDGSVRQCFADVMDAIDFTTESFSPLGRFGVSLILTDPFWQDLNSITQTRSGTPASARFSDYAGATAPMEDLVVTILGPWSNPRLTFEDGSWVQYNEVLTGTQGIVVDSGEWSLAGVGGYTPSLSKLQYSGVSSHWVAMPPSEDENGPSITFGGTGRTSASTVTLQGRRKFLVG